MASAAAQDRKDRALRGVRRGVELIAIAVRQGQPDAVCDILRQLADLPDSPLSLTELLSESGTGEVRGSQRAGSDATR